MRAGERVQPPRVASAKTALEREMYALEHWPPMPDGREHHAVVGREVGIYIADKVIKDGLVGEIALRLRTRRGSRSYGTLGEIFEMNRPG